MTDEQNPETSSIAESFEDLAMSEGSSSFSESSADEKDQSKKKKKSKINSFLLELHPASKLKHAMLALSDSEFNEPGTAVIEVEHKELTITVRNTEKNDLGYLRLLPKGFVKYDFHKPLKRKMINLVQILDYLKMAHDNDTVTIKHVEGSDEISFMFGSPTVVKFGAVLSEIGAEFEMCPDIITYACECVILNPDLWKFLRDVEKSEGKLVGFGISDTMVTLLLGNRGITVKYDDPKVGGIRGMEPGQLHQTFFEWPYYKSLKKASYVAKGVLLCLVTDPKVSVMWRFNLQELGDLVYIKEATVFMPNAQADSDEPVPGTEDNNNPTEAFDILVSLEELAIL